MRRFDILKKKGGLWGLFLGAETAAALVVVVVVVSSNCFHLTEGISSVVPITVALATGRNVTGFSARSIS